MRLETTITGITSELQGVGRSIDGRALFIDGAIPGERVLADVEDGDGRFLKGKALQVLAPSAGRAQPMCPYYAACGGCRAQHMTYDMSLIQKKRVVEDALSRIGGLNVEVNDVLPSPETARYRNKAEYAVNGGKVGLREGDSHAIVEVEDCLLQHEKSISAMRMLREWLKGNRFGVLKYLVTRVSPAGEMSTTLSYVGDAPRILPNLEGLSLCRLKPRYTHALDGDVVGGKQLRASLSGLEFELSPKSFFQVNYAQAKNLYARAVEYADLSGKETAIDAYSGVGAIALFMAKSARRVTGVEVVKEAVRDAQKNAELSGLSKRAQFQVGAAELLIPEMCKREKTDVITLDPPRKGVDQRLIDACLRANPARIVYVSCNPATLARDLKRFCEKGAYRVMEVQPFDMFPWTAHVETVVLMSRVE